MEFEQNQTNIFFSSLPRKSVDRSNTYINFSRTKVLHSNCNWPNERIKYVVSNCCNCSRVFVFHSESSASWWLWRASCTATYRFCVFIRFLFRIFCFFFSLEIKWISHNAKQFRCNVIKALLSKSNLMFVRMVVGGMCVWPSKTASVFADSCCSTYGTLARKGEWITALNLVSNGGDNSVSNSHMLNICAILHCILSLRSRWRMNCFFSALVFFFSFEFLPSLPTLLCHMSFHSTVFFFLMFSTWKN